MPDVAGITTQKDSTGNLTYVTINVEKHREAIMPILHRLGVVEKSQFDRDCENAISVDELRQSLHNKIYAVWGK